MLRFMYLTLIFLSVWNTSVQPASALLKKTMDESVKEELTAFVSRLFTDRAQYLIDHDKDHLMKHYVQDIASSRHALHREIARGDYVKAWAEHRGLHFTDAHSHVRIVRIVERGNEIFISAVQSLRLDYAYTHSRQPVQSFGIGTRHGFTLTKKNGMWQILREWYLDPLEENPKLIPDSSGMIFRPHEERKDGSTLEEEQAVPSNRKQRYNRQKAVDYANKYAGTAWGAGHNNRYNQKYRDYSGEGGDCTNFASQCVGDQEEGGGLPKKAGWRHIPSVGGTQTWVQTDAFKNFLIHSGYGRVIASGSFEQIVKPSDRFPKGAIAALKPGDLIAYVMKGDVDHFAIVVGFDVLGYVLVNCHSADRYRVPFDLGWDKHTRYILIHIRD
ncbi:hypothetical protein BVG16_10435 [Paenibacillus selenitireducens]|uniref:Putative amidase domain-containing protein n=1 Tax=Paenibacillus selenitireducens TaxID=1324314 RepID=A0A1T2XIE0_9BACL|nr:amidase domain-containing protein [Paenibacillus selenitireducens]OPA79476.1 hypothetical protein BVG16_10435 [Paenibacillus selenitireducens]